MGALNWPNRRVIPAEPSQGQERDSKSYGPKTLRPLCRTLRVDSDQHQSSSSHRPFARYVSTADSQPRRKSVWEIPIQESSDVDASLVWCKVRLVLCSVRVGYGHWTEARQGWWLLGRVDSGVVPRSLGLVDVYVGSCTGCQIHPTRQII